MRSIYILWVFVKMETRLYGIPFAFRIDILDSQIDKLWTLKMKTRLYGIRYAFDIDILDSEND
jgi:hypothetical protein